MNSNSIEDAFSPKTLRFSFFMSPKVRSTARFEWLASSSPFLTDPIKQ